jgi:hypothetical protein
MSPKQKRQAPTAYDVRPQTVTVGSNVDASCTKCKTVTSHVIMAKVGAVPARVQCLTCSTLHAYRAPRRPSARAPAIDERSVEQIWHDAMKRCRAAVVPYSTRQHYEIGARVNHLSFGEGVVSRLQSTTVCEVIFMTGAVKLLMGSTR